MMIVFGPVPSRRLGRSIGINNIPPKYCSYSCIYCQLGTTDHMSTERRDFYEIDQIMSEVQEKMRITSASGDKIDYLTFVADGEPTLDINLGDLIKRLKTTGIPIAVITNASLLSNPQVRQELHLADWVSIKVDAITDAIWRKIDRPIKLLNHQQLLDGIIAFSKEFQGILATETMLLNEINDNLDELEKIASFISQIHPKTAYISIPIRPPAVSNTTPANEYALTQSMHIFSKWNLNVEFLTCYEGNAFASTGNFEADILSITSVHPMKKEAVKDLVRKCQTNWSSVEQLIQDQKILQIEYQGDTFFIRKLH